jgi:hypothetical protein
MARRKTQAAGNLAEFKDKDHDEQVLEKLSAARAAEGPKAGHNSGDPPDEALRRNMDALELAQIEINNAQKLVQKARAEFGVAKKNAKTELGSKSWVDACVATVKIEMEANKGGMGEIITEHRQIGRLLRLRNHPLGHQFNLFAVPAEDSDGAKIDATAQGEQAGREGVPRDDNKYSPGSADWFAWNNGWQVGQDSIAATLGRGNDEQSH